MEVALSCGDLGLPIDILRIILLEGMRENYMKCIMAGVCELWKRVMSYQSFFNESMGIGLWNGSLALPSKILEKILFETMKCGDHTFLKLGLVCKLWYQMTKTNSFREKVHFGWLSRIKDNWDAVPDFKREYYVIYDVRECFDCRKIYKDCQGYNGRGEGGIFYESGLCRICSSALGPD